MDQPDSMASLPPGLRPDSNEHLSEDEHVSEHVDRRLRARGSSEARMGLPIGRRPLPRQLGASSETSTSGASLGRRDLGWQLPRSIEDPAPAPRCSSRDSSRDSSREWERWSARWQQRLDDWWRGLPLLEQEALGSCLGALGLHLGSRLQAALPKDSETLQAALPRPSATPPPTVGSEAGCDWLGHAGRLSLPDFPTLPNAPDAFKAPIPWAPIPWLLPLWQKERFLQSIQLGGQHRQQAQLHRPQGRTASRHQQARRQWWASVGAGAGAGLAVGSSLMLGVLILSHRHRWQRATRQ